MVGKRRLVWVRLGEGRLGYVRQLRLGLLRIGYVNLSYFMLCSVMMR
jgi:hypothetical protein